MNDRMFNRQPTDPTWAPSEAMVADSAGVAWGHSNPAELYRWVSQRNALLGTIAAAFSQFAARPMVG